MNNKKRIKKLHLKTLSDHRDHHKEFNYIEKTQQHKDYINISKESIHKIKQNLPELQLPKMNNENSKTSKYIKHKKSSSTIKGNDSLLPNIVTPNRIKRKIILSMSNKTNSVGKGQSVSRLTVNAFNKPKENVSISTISKHSENNHKIKNNLNINIIFSSKSSNNINRIYSTSNIFSQGNKNSIGANKYHISTNNVSKENPISLNLAPRTTKVSVKTITQHNNDNRNESGDESIVRKTRTPNKDLKSLGKEFKSNDNIQNEQNINNVEHKENNKNINNNTPNIKESNSTVKPKEEEKASSDLSNNKQQVPPSLPASHLNLKVKLNSILLSYSSLSNFKVQNFKKSYLTILPTSSTLPVHSYAGNTHNGTIRAYNEDRISAVALSNNIAYLFAVYDGHGGNGCSSFLQSELHNYITNITTKSHIENSILRCEDDFMTKVAINQKGGIIDKSGSCAIIALVTEAREIIFINIGDSRGLLISSDFNVLYTTEDHKPNEKKEHERITRAGGSIYQNPMTCQLIQNGEVIKNGPFRVFPGRLSVSRTIGDVELKTEKYGRKKGIIIPNPDITIHNNLGGAKYIVLGCDGIFDVLSNEEIAAMFIEAKENTDNKEHFCDVVADMIIKGAMIKESFDNVSCVVVELKL